MNDAGLEPLTTPRLRLRLPRSEDAAFLMRLMNDPDCLRFIGDRGIRTEQDAARYVEKQLTSFGMHGCGLFVVEAREDGVTTGICGLVRRPTLDSPDLGFAFLPEYRGRGYAVEAGACALEDARTRLKAQKILAITDPENHASIRVLERLGMVAAGIVNDADGAGALRLFAWMAAPFVGSEQQHS
jgi:RimJ/RimL family protein N-acetyltransferase